MKTEHPQNQEAFEFDLPAGNIYTIGQVSSILHLNKDSVITLCDAGELEWFSHAPSGGGGGKSGITRLTRRITRRSVVLYRMRCAHFAPEAFGELFLREIEALRDRDLLLRIITVCTALYRRLSA